MLPDQDSLVLISPKPRLIQKDIDIRFITEKVQLLCYHREGGGNYVLGGNTD